MCGILGRISLSEKIDASFMKSALDLMIHRGPDAYGEWMNEEENSWFGHRRLSIIDLSDLGAQPMVSFDKTLIIVFNGEIYNYKIIKDELRSKGYHFKSQSDTEVLLNAWHCWGVDTLEKIDGMFAFSILDLVNNRLTMARDRIGEKPLYYRFTNQGFIFASELKSILHVDGDNRKINHIALDCLLGFGYVPGDLSIIDGVKKLPPASYLTWQIGNSTPIVKKYWIPASPPASYKEESLLLEELDTI